MYKKEVTFQSSYNTSFVTDHEVRSRLQATVFRIPLILCGEGSKWHEKREFDHQLKHHHLSLPPPSPAQPRKQSCHSVRAACYNNVLMPFRQFFSSCIKRVYNWILREPLNGSLGRAYNHTTVRRSLSFAWAWTSDSDVSGWWPKLVCDCLFAWPWLWQCQWQTRSARSC